MQKYSKSEIRKVKALRKKGVSIQEIMSICNMPKTTVWHYIQEVVLTDKQQRELRSRQGGSTRRTQEQWVKAGTHADEVLANTHHLNLTIAVSMLYWAEGNKEALVFTNSEERIIVLYLQFLHEVLQVDVSDIQLLIRIADPIDPNAALRHWSQATGLHKENITVHSDNRQNKTRKEFGICRVYVKKSGYLHKVLQSVIQKLSDKLLLS